MGTKLQYASNPLAASPNNSFDANLLGDWRNFPNPGPKVSLQSSAFEITMDRRMFEQNNKDSIKNTMLMHENMFKHQVRELHRLYSVQRMLMDEMRNGTKQSRNWGPMPDSEIDHSQFFNQHQPKVTSGYNLHVQKVRHSQSLREQSGCSSAEALKMPKGFDLERPAEENMSVRHSAMEEDQAGPSSHIHPKNSKMSINGADDESDVELTLSIGGSTARNRSERHWPHRLPELDCTGLAHNISREPGTSAMFKANGEDECGTPSSSMSSSSATLNQQSKQPQWLFQGLSLNRT